MCFFKKYDESPKQGTGIRSFFSSFKQFSPLLEKIKHRCQTTQSFLITAQ
jgi:hypothetical protein